MSQVQREARSGRPPATSAVDLERVALELFTDHGFVATTVEDIAAAAGISRRTFFRYYASKNDVVWGDFDGLLRDLDASLSATADDVPLLTALTEAVIRFNTVGPYAVAAHRQRMALILHVPALQAHSTLRYADWRAVVSRFAAARLGAAVDDLVPQLVGHVALAAAVAAYERWLTDESAELTALLADAYATVELDLSRTDGAARSA